MQILRMKFDYFMHFSKYADTINYSDCLMITDFISKEDFKFVDFLFEKFSIPAVIFS